ncbi:MAG: acyl-CoA dehydrogenase family protein [Planctomycetes bacterium]|nr:acyl-CoA dehydrogenase family protein [Planctomycetota bacterium]
MDFNLPEELQLIQQTARDFADRELAPLARRLDREERFHKEHWAKLAGLGFLGFLIPEKYGGAGLGNLALVIALEELNRACASTGVTVSVHNSLAGGPVVKFGSEGQKARYLPKLASGEIFGAYALTEPGHGSDAAALETRAVLKGDRYVLNGRKAWITSGAMAGLVIAFATVDPSKRSKGITAFLVEPSFPGFKVGRHEKKLGIRGSETVELVFEDLEVPGVNRLGEEGGGFAIAMDSLNGGRIGIAAQAIGIAQACLDASVRYARERRQFGRPIAHFQPVQWKIAGMAAGLELARTLAHKAAWLRDQGQPHTREAAIAKLHASELANRAATDAVQIHGGAGYCTDFPVERYFRDAKVTEIYEGTSEIQRLVIARGVLGDLP